MSKELIIRKDSIVVRVTHNDVEPELMGSPVVQRLEEGYGTRIGFFENGVAEVSWKLKPYRYSELDYGVPTWQRDCIAYGFINEEGRIIVKFQYTDYEGLSAMRKEAERLAAKVKYSGFMEITTVSPEERRNYRIGGDPRDYDNAFIEALEEAAKKRQTQQHI